MQQIRLGFELEFVMAVADVRLIVIVFYFINWSIVFMSLVAVYPTEYLISGESGLTYQYYLLLFIFTFKLFIGFLNFPEMLSHFLTHLLGLL